MGNIPNKYQTKEGKTKHVPEKEKGKTKQGEERTDIYQTRERKTEQVTVKELPDKEKLITKTQKKSRKKLMKMVFFTK